MLATFGWIIVAAGLVLWTIGAHAFLTVELKRFLRRGRR